MIDLGKTVKIKKKLISRDISIGSSLSVRLEVSLWRSVGISTRRSLWFNLREQNAS